MGKSATKLGGKGNSSQAGIILNSYKKSTQQLDTEENTTSNNKKGSTAKLLTQNLHIIQVPIMQDYGQFNQCPKLDEVALIEPLICKRIANERLTSSESNSLKTIMYLV